MNINFIQLNIALKEMKSDKFKSYVISEQILMRLIESNFAVNRNFLIICADI